MKRPNPFLYLPTVWLARIHAYLTGQRIRRLTRIKRPAIVLANHTSFLDFLYSTVALFPTRLTYVAVDKMFYMPVEGLFLRLGRAIPKCLFQSDLRVGINIFKVLKRKGVVCIYPEGQISPIGKTLTPPFQIAKLIKKAGVNVYLCKHYGAYLAHPPWTKKHFKGRVETVVDLLIDKHEVRQLDADAIYQHIRQGLDYNASLDNQTKQWRYKVSDISNFESVIYQCPACQAETMATKQNILYCQTCGQEYVYDDHGLVGGQTIDVLYRLQEDYIRAYIHNNPMFRWDVPVALESYQGKRIRVVGAGTLSLTYEAYIYEGTMHGKDVSLTFKTKDVPTLPSDIGINVQIYRDYILYQFVIKDDRKMATKLVIAGETLYQLNQGSQTP